MAGLACLLLAFTIGRLSLSGPARCIFFSLFPTLLRLFRDDIILFQYNEPDDKASL